MPAPDPSRLREGVKKVAFAPSRMREGRETY
jgi:hypothetical protein